MAFKYKLSAKHCLAVLLMVAPATAYTNINTTTNIDDGSPATSQANLSESAWITHAGMHSNVLALVSALTDAEAHGLNPETYGLKNIKQQVRALVTNGKRFGIDGRASYVEQRKILEASLSSAFIKFIEDMGSGVLDAQETQNQLYRSPPTIDSDSLLSRLNTGQATVDELITEVSQSNPAYLKLVKHMRLLLDQRDYSVQRTQVRLFEAAKLNSNHQSLINLKARLKETGDLDIDARISTFFGNDVKKALMKVQRRHGITATGELNERTVIALNATIDDDIEEVAMNLERWRWMPRDLGERHININIPAYNLTMMNRDQRVIDMDVVVGSKDNRTPVFSKGANIIEVAPTWTLPESITNKEIIPMELEKPGYIESQRMDYFRWKNNELVKVDRAEIKPEDFLKKPFPYVLRQRAGKGNALGDIKILMPNKYAIYMHDTQAKSLFKKTDRAYSHGCIRLSDPFLLGNVLLQMDGKSEAETKEILGKKKTTRVKLKTKTPTHITYFTAWIDDDGRLNKRQDVYEHNDKLITGMYAENTLLSNLKYRPVTVLAEQSDL